MTPGTEISDFSMGGGKLNEMFNYAKRSLPSTCSVSVCKELQLSGMVSILYLDYKYWTQSASAFKKPVLDVEKC